MLVEAVIVAVHAWDQEICRFAVMFSKMIRDRTTVAVLQQ